MQFCSAGNIGGLVGITVVYPLDTVKIRLQTNKEYKGAYDVITKMIRSDGIGSLYRGITSPAIGFGLTFAVSFRCVCVLCSLGKRSVTIYSPSSQLIYLKLHFEWDL